MLAHWGKSYDKPRQHIKKQRDYSAYKVYIAKTVFVFFFFLTVIIYRYEIWTIKKAEHQELMLLNCVGEDS